MTLSRPNRATAETSPPAYVFPYVLHYGTEVHFGPHILLGSLQAQEKEAEGRLHSAKPDQLTRKSPIAPLVSSVAPTTAFARSHEHTRSP